MAKKTKSSLLPVLGFLGVSGLFVWWASRSDKQQRYQTLPPSPAAWQKPLKAKLAADIRVNGNQVLLKGSTVYAVRSGPGEFAITEGSNFDVTTMKVDDLAWYAVQPADLTDIQEVKR